MRETIIRAGRRGRAGGRGGRVGPRSFCPQHLCREFFTSEWLAWSR